MPTGERARMAITTRRPTTALVVGVASLFAVVWVWNVKERSSPLFSDMIRRRQLQATLPSRHPRRTQQQHYDSPYSYSSQQQSSYFSIDSMRKKYDDQHASTDFTTTTQDSSSSHAPSPLQQGQEQKQEQLFSFNDFQAQKLEPPYVESQTPEGTKSLETSLGSQREQPTSFSPYSTDMQQQAPQEPSFSMDGSVLSAQQVTAAGRVIYQLLKDKPYDTTPYSPTTKTIARQQPPPRTNTKVTTTHHDRPIMYTFFNPLLEDAFVTEMSPDGDAHLVEEWKRQWSVMGWDPVVLNLEHAKQHPDYAELAQQIENSNLDGYNKMCIWRWLAMAAVGGGWAADYDTFPLRSSFAAEVHDGKNPPLLPNDGELTVHDMHIPDLVSGSANEWLRLAHQITKSLMKHVVPPIDDRTGRRQYTVWSDMKALQEWQGTDMYKIDRRRVMIRTFDQPDEALGQPWSKAKCQERTPAPDIVCVHFSHASLHKAMNDGMLHPGQSTNDRAAIAREWLQTWHDSCGG